MDFERKTVAHHEDVCTDMIFPLIRTLLKIDGIRIKMNRLLMLVDFVVSRRGENH